MRRRHPNKEIEAALQLAESHGWRVVPGGSHAWGRIYCPAASADCRCGAFCITSVWSTPRNPDTHARFLNRVVTRCVGAASVRDAPPDVEEFEMDYEFTLHFRLTQAPTPTQEQLDRLFAAGCDDAVVGLGIAGHLALAFCRTGRDAGEALRSAVRDVRRALPEAELTEVAPDLGGLSDVAGLVEVSRQNLRRLMLDHAGDFPAPLHAGTTLLWNMAEVLQWLQDRAGYSLPPELLEVSRAAWAANAEIGADRRRRIQRAAR